MNIELGQILSRAWNITWKHKILWVFGFFSILAGEGGGGGNFGGGSGFRVSNNDVSRYTGELPPEIQNIVNWFNQLDWATIVLYFCILIGVILLLWIICFVLGIIGRGGLIGGILKADADNTVSFREAWTLGRRYFWRILVIKIIAFLTLLAASIVTGLSIIMAFIPFVCCLGIPLCILAIAGLLFLSLYFYFVQLAVVAENLDLGAASGRGFHMLRDHIGPAILVGFILFMVSLGVGLVAFAMFLPVIGLALAGFWPMIAQFGSINMGMLYAAGIMFLVLLPVTWLIQSVIETWQTAVWALAYKRFTQIPSAPATQTR